VQEGRNGPKKGKYEETLCFDELDVLLQDCRLRLEPCLASCRFKKTAFLVQRKFVHLVKFGFGSRSEPQFCQLNLNARYLIFGSVFYRNLTYPEANIMQ
jgi:hypothetical protein